jgi:hypothetical protein
MLEDVVSYPVLVKVCNILPTVSLGDNEVFISLTT